MNETSTTSTPVDPTQDPAVLQALNRYQLGLPRLPTAGRSGELLGRGTGSSLEFQEYREYLPGDDLRHVDWGAYARTDALMVRLFREEISPRTELILDASKSMTTQQGVKRTLSIQLTSLFAQLAGRLGGQPDIHFLGAAQPPLKLSMKDLSRIAEFPFDGVRNLGELLQEHALALKPQAVRIVVSDFLFPLDPDKLVKQLASRASTLWLVQVLADWEAHPEQLSGRRLIDVETSQHADMLLNNQAIKTYKERLLRLQDGLQVAARRAHANFVTVIAEQGLDDVCRNELTGIQMLRPV